MNGGKGSGKRAADAAHQSLPADARAMVLHDLKHEEEVKEEVHFNFLSNDLKLQPCSSSQKLRDDSLGFLATTRTDRQATGQCPRDGRRKLDGVEYWARLAPLT